jgi:hypothetical protein
MPTPARSRFLLRHSNTTGIADVSFVYGPGGAGWRPLTAEFEGRGVIATYWM